MGVGREPFEMELHVFVQHFVLGQQVGEPAKLRLVGQVAIDQQIGDFDEGGFFRQFLDGIPAIAQDAFFPVDERDLAAARAGVAVAVVQRDGARVLAKR